MEENKITWVDLIAFALLGALCALFIFGCALTGTVYDLYGEPVYTWDGEALPSAEAAGALLPSVLGFEIPWGDIFALFGVGGAGAVYGLKKRHDAKKREQSIERMSRSIETAKAKIGKAEMIEILKANGVTEDEVIAAIYESKVEE